MRYRSYTFEEIETEGASVVLTGPNGAGKTNVLEAVSMLTPGRGLRRASAEEGMRRPDTLGWRVRALVDTGTDTVEIATGVDDPDAPRRGVEIDRKPAPQTALGRLLRLVWLTPAMDRLWTGPAAERRGFLDRATMGFFPEHAETTLAHEKAMRARNRLLKIEREGGGRPDRAWIEGLEAQMARAGARLARARAEALARLSAAQEAVKTATAEGDALFPRARLSIVGDMEHRFAEALASGDDLDVLEADATARTGRALGLSRARDAAAGRTLEGPHRSDLDAVYAVKDMPARDCSTGEQKALLISLCLASARALSRATGATPVLLFDEVAAHLDERRRRALFAEIDALGAQAWMTGTDAGLFDGLSGALRLDVTERRGVSAIEAAS
ncbi:MAG: DNA replication/repair protein RecF [Paracoccaceae bacterium]